ncbi:MAG: DUF3857 domain-containing protein [Spirochaetes bacterium]|nr:DUF3857 domain-containing protein [Spirochaetota bacterium]
MKKLYFTFILFFFTVFKLISSEITKEQSLPNTHIIILKDGSEYKGNLLKIEDGKIYFKINNDERIFNKDYVDRIQFQQRRIYQDIKSITEISDQEIQYLWENSKKREKDPNEPIVMLLDKLVVEYLSDRKVKINIKKAFKILNEAGKEYSTQFFYYLKNHSDYKLLYGITVLPDGSVSSIEETAVNDEPINNQIPDYNLLHRVKFGLKDVDVESVFVWEAEITRDFDNVKLPFLVEKELIEKVNIEKQIIKILAPKNLKINYTIYDGLIPYKKVKLKKYREKNKIIYQVEQNNIPAFIEDENNIPSASIIFPKIYACLKSSWLNIGKEIYKNFFYNKDNAKFNELLKSIIGNETDKYKQIQLIYDYINRKINLINIPPDEFYYLPLIDDKIINLSTLNILDKTYLFIRLLNILNIESKFYYYRENYKNKITDKIQSLKLLDNVACEVNINDKKLIVSFENQNFNIGQHYYSVSNAHALIIDNRSKKLINIEKIAFDYNFTERKYKCLLREDNTLELKRTTVISGTDQAFWRNKRFLSKGELDKYMETRISNLGSNVELKNYSFPNKLENFDELVIIEEEIEIKDFAFASGDLYKIFKIPEFTFSAGSVSKKQRSLPYDLDRTEKSRYVFEITLPENYRVLYLPDNLNMKTDDYSISADFESNVNNINIIIELIYFNDIISTEKYNGFKQWMENNAKLSKEWILLERIS